MPPRQKKKAAKLVDSIEDREEEKEEEEEELASVKKQTGDDEDEDGRAVRKMKKTKKEEDDDDYEHELERKKGVNESSLVMVAPNSSARTNVTVNTNEYEGIVRLSENLMTLESGNKVSLTPIMGGCTENDGDDGDDDDENSTKKREPMCYLLQIDDANILLDCGWDDSFNLADLRALEKIAPTLDCVLISHATQRHIGAIPVLFSKLNCNKECKVYATIPTHKLGQMLCYDYALGYSEFRGEFSGYTLDEVDFAFSKFVPVKYQQHSRVSIARKNNNNNNNNNSSSNSSGSSDIVVEAINAGHTLGGSCWRISKDAEDIVYAVDYNMRKERHLAGTTLAETVHRPSVLITDCRNVDRKAPESRLQVRDLPLVDCVLKHARMEGNVVICCDPVGRTLELALLLEETWKNQNLGSYQLVLFNNVAANALEFARSHLEWMSEDVGLKFDSTRRNVFDVKRLFPCHSYEDFARLPPGPKVVLASLASLECGFARKLFTEWASNAKNCFVWPDESGYQIGLAKDIVKKSKKKTSKAVTIKVELAKRETLAGDELEEWMREQEVKRLELAKKKEEERRRIAEQEEKKRLLEEEMDVDAATLSQPAGKEDEEMEEEAQIVAPSEPHNTPNEETAVTIRENQRTFERRECIVDGFIPESFDYLVFPDETKLTNMCDPETNTKTDYGEAIDAEAFFRVANELRPEMTRDQSFESAGDVDKLSSGVDMDGITVTTSYNVADKQPGIGNDDDLSGAKEKPLERPVEIPTKVVKEVKDVIIKAAIESNFDYDGLADGQSVRAIIPRLEPRRVILVGGTIKDAEKLASHLLNDSEHFPKSSKIDFPKNNETLDASSVHPTYKVRLSEAVLSSARLRQVNGYAVGWIDGVIGPIPEDGSAPELLPVPVNALKLTVSKTVKDESLLAGVSSVALKKETALAVIEENDEDGGTEISVIAKHHRRSAFVGDVRLSEFRRYLQRMGVPAEFGEGGALVCANGQVIVRRRAEDDELIVEGSISDAYFNVRDALYAQYQIL